MSLAGVSRKHVALSLDTGGGKWQFEARDDRVDNEADGVADIV